MAGGLVVDLLLMLPILTVLRSMVALRLTESIRNVLMAGQSGFEEHCQGRLPAAA